MRGAAVILLAVGLLGCPQSAVVQRPGEPAVVNFDEADPEMQAAISRARASFPAFASHLPLLREQRAYFSIKVPIEAGEGVEHVWLDAPELDEDAVEGALGNAPLAGPHRLGEVVRIPLEEISDWMAVVDGELYGGFTVLVARARMSASERAAFDESIGFTVPSTPREF